LNQRARVLYESILTANPTNELGFALRDKVPFDKLKDESKVQVATAVVLFAKGIAKLEEDAKAASEQATSPAPDTAPKTVPETTQSGKENGKKK
jgi:hypothetical protein